MKRLILLPIIALLFECHKPATPGITYWLTTPDRQSLLAQSPSPLIWAGSTGNVGVIAVDTAFRYQKMEGFGYALTGGSAQVINSLPVERRAKLLQELFTTEGNGIGISYLRVSMGASDLDDHVFSYNDLPAGQQDPQLKEFSLKEDMRNLIPVLKEILTVAPGIKIMGSPWSAPAWMKTNGNPKDGSLKTEFYDAYSRYFVKYIQGMAAEGIIIDAVTLQNEPENPKNNPSMLMSAGEEAKFVRDYLGPAFAKEGITTKIVVWDHNCDHFQYPIEVLNDAEAKKFIAGSAFHLYLGEINALSKVKAEHPDRDIYFTEQWTSSKGSFAGDLAWHTKQLIIGAPRNSSVNVLEWNLAADPQEGPHTEEGGCTECLGALTISDSVRRNVSYYIIGHASRFVPPGSVRIYSGELNELPTVAYITPQNKKVLIVLNEAKELKEFAIRYGKKQARTVLPPGTVATYVWR